MGKDILFTFLALCGATILWVLFLFWHLDLFRTESPSTHKMLGSHKENKDEEPPTFI